MKLLHLVFASTLLAMTACTTGSDKLEMEFKNPPPSVQTSIYWYWVSGNISQEGIVKDLQAMKQAGIGRVFIGNIGIDGLKGPRDVKFDSEEWWACLRTALRTASELDIEVGIFNSPGWSQSGGPWVKPEEAMRYLAASPVTVDGGGHITLTIPASAAAFQDVRTIAYPLPAGEVFRGKAAILPAMAICTELTDENPDTSLSLTDSLTVEFSSDAPFTARSLTIVPAARSIDADAELLALCDGVWRSVKQLQINRSNASLNVGFEPYAPVVASFEAVTASAFRLRTMSRTQGALAEVVLSSAPRVEGYAEKSLAKMCQTPLPYWDHYMWPAQPAVNDPSLVIDPAAVVDISGNISPDGKLDWEAPAGRWQILRLGMIPTGVTNSPADPEATGLEIDKMSRKHVETHFDAYIGRILERIPAPERRTFRVVVQDSYETGGQNFTDDFLRIFKERYGYNPLPYLPVLYGEVVASPELSDRFLWDLRRLVADKVAYDYVGGLRDVCHRHGLTTWLENYGHWGFPGEFLQYGGQSDEISGEYWSVGDLGDIENRAASSCGHIYNKQLISAESNTCGGPAFLRSPAMMKQRTDRFFTEGINNTLLHLYIQQPDDSAPGMNAWFGNEFNRHNTWFAQMDLFVQYLRRCNYMLRQGLNIADVAYYIGEDAPKMTGVQDPALPVGYQFDYINAEVLLRDAKVRDGLLTLPHGTSYRVLVLPRLETMRPEVARKIQELVSAGAVVVGSAPQRSPSLENYPKADAVVAAVAAEVWGAPQERTTGGRKFGRGWIFDGVSLEEVLTHVGTAPDCKGPEGMLYNHRRTDDAEIYFISNQADAVLHGDVTFRTGGRVPELWDALTGEVRPLPEFLCEGEQTVVPIELAPYGSAFVVFRADNNGGKGVKGVNFPTSGRVQPFDTPWQVSFDGRFSVPAARTMETLSDLSLSESDSVKYFSGTIIYETAFEAEQPTAGRVWLNLGCVHEMAKVWINGQYAGGVWTSPYRVDVTDYLTEATNKVRIEVVNTWVNRLVGDLRLPVEQRQTWCPANPYGADSQLQPSGLSGTVTLDYEVCE